MKKDFKLFKEFAERALGCSLESVRPSHLSGDEVVKALWPLNERFRPHLDSIRSLTYDKSFELEADEAIAALATSAQTSWDDLSAGAWRVLLERQQQAITVALSNEMAGNPLMPIPPGFSDEQKTVAVALFLLLQMKLPWPPADRSGFEVPPGSATASLRRH